jgi:hypothetical protein
LWALTLKEVKDMKSVVISKNEREENRVRALLAQRGYRLMHRRNGQYWVMFADPYGLDAIKDALPRLPKVR